MKIEQKFEKRVKEHIKTVKKDVQLVVKKDENAKPQKQELYLIFCIKRILITIYFCAILIPYAFLLSVHYLTNRVWNMIRFRNVDGDKYDCADHFDRIF